MNRPATTSYVASGDLLRGASALLPTNCTPQTGPANVDGQCIMGGKRLPVGRHGDRASSGNPTDLCSAYPVYVMNNVPYTIGRVAGSDYSALANIYTYTKLNDNWATRVSSAKAS